VKSLLVLATIAIAAAGASAGQSGSLREAAKSATFHDTVGESPLGPDITTVVASNDAGRLSFSIGIPGHPDLTEDMRIRVWLDTDVDLDTGLGPNGVRGADKFILVDRWQYGLGEVALFTCSGAVCSGGKSLPTESGASPSFSYRDGATFTVDAADLGIERLGRLQLAVEA
jgi:hypothetical protein